MFACSLSALPTKQIGRRRDADGIGAVHARHGHEAGHHEAVRQPKRLDQGVQGVLCGGEHVLVADVTINTARSFLSFERHLTAKVS